VLSFILFFSFTFGHKVAGHETCVTVQPSATSQYRIPSEGRVIWSLFKKTDKICTLNGSVLNG
jgi:hypothetical protein